MRKEAGSRREGQLFGMVLDQGGGGKGFVTPHFNDNEGKGDMHAPSSSGAHRQTRPQSYQRRSPSSCSPWRAWHASWVPPATQEREVLERSSISSKNVAP